MWVFGLTDFYACAHRIRWHSGLLTSSCRRWGWVYCLSAASDSAVLRDVSVMASLRPGAECKDEYTGDLKIYGFKDLKGSTSNPKVFSSSLLIQNTWHY